MTEDADVLLQVADAADRTAREQRRVATASRRVAEQRGRGVPWSTIARRGAARELLHALGSGAQRLRGAAGRLRLLMAQGLAEEGATTREIGRQFGVSHQRISWLLSRGEP